MKTIALIVGIVLYLLAALFTTLAAYTHADPGTELTAVFGCLAIFCALPLFFGIVAWMLDRWN